MIRPSQLLGESKFLVFLEPINQEERMTKKIFYFIGWIVPVLLLPTGVLGAEVAPYTASEAVQFSGSGTTTTRPFTVKGEWELQWKAKGFLAVHLYNLESRVNEKLMFVYTTEGGKGASYHPDAGTFFLNIVASEPWSISILDLKPAKSE
jgi:hypothetical protein